MQLHPERPWLFHTSVGVELDLADCRGFSVQISLTYDPRTRNILSFLNILYRESYKRSLTYRRMES